MSNTNQPGFSISALLFSFMEGYSIAKSTIFAAANLITANSGNSGICFVSGVSPNLNSIS